MAFALAGNVITQTGTDTDLSGLDGLAGVTTTTSGHQTIYTLDNRRLLIQGTLDHDPDRELIVTNYNGDSAMLVTGTYNFGAETVVNGNRRLSGSTGVIFTGISGASQRFWRALDQGGLVIQNPGTLNAVGGVMVASRPFGFYTNGVTVNIDSTRFIKAGVGTERREFRFDEDEVISGTVTNMVIDGFQVSHRSTPSGGMSVVMADAEIVQLSGGPALTVLSEIDTSNNIAADTDLGTDDNQGVSRSYEVTNTSNGSGLRLMPKSGVGTGRQRGYLRVFKSLSFVFADELGAVVDGVKTYAIDTDNGFRKNANGLDSLADKTYEATSDAVGQVSLTVETAVTNIDSEGAFTYDQWDTTALGNRFKVDRRGLDDTTDDRFRFRFGSYLFGLAETTQQCKGLGLLSVPWTLFTDPAVTELSKSVVDGYGTLGNNARLHDRAKSFLVDNWGTYLDLIIDRDGNTTHDVVIDPNAPEAFDFDGSTITVKTDQFVGNVTTTGTVTVSAGASVFGTITDTNGVRGDVPITFTGLPIGAEFRIYDDDLDGIANTIGNDRDGIEALTGTTFEFVHDVTEAGNTVSYQVIAPGDFVEETRTVQLQTSAQTIPVTLRPETNF